MKEFKDLPKVFTGYTDDNNKQGTLAAINGAHIVIPVISHSYFDYVDSDIESALINVAESEDRYLLPLIVHDTDWSSYDWIIKSQITPEDSTSILLFSESEIERILSEFAKKINTIISGYSFEYASVDKADLVGNKIVFISHDHDDADFAELLKLRLEKEGINSWIDTERLKVGQDWRSEIDTGIENSAAVIVIMTPEARKSEYVTYEWAFAWGKNKKIFPIMLKQTALHPRLESLQYLNFTSSPTRPWGELIDSIKSIIQ